MAAVTTSAQSGSNSLSKAIRANLQTFGLIAAVILAAQMATMRRR